jgi:mycothiol synthase
VIAQPVAISTSVGLNDDDLQAVRALLARSNADDGTELLLALKSTKSGDDNLPLYLLIRDGDTLIGVAELIGYREIEGTIIIAPERRRQGLGRRLVTLAGQELAERELTDWLLVCDEAFPGGAAFARAFGGERAYFEHRLTLDPALVQPIKPQTERITIRQAERTEASAIIAITAEAFGDPPAEVGKWIGNDLDRTDRRWFVATHDGEPLGSLRVVDVDGGVDVTAFGVLPQHQGRGYGRAILSHTIRHLLDQGVTPINIEVETENAVALGLYRSCGFVPQHTYGYYRVPTKVR